MKEETMTIEKHPDRRMTIVRGNRFLPDSREFIPCLHLTGIWMYEAGFCPGDKIVIEVKEGSLKIRKVPCI